MSKQPLKTDLELIEALRDELLNLSAMALTQAGMLLDITTKIAQLQTQVALIEERLEALEKREEVCQT